MIKKISVLKFINKEVTQGIGIDSYDRARFGIWAWWSCKHREWRMRGEYMSVHGIK